MDKAHRLWEELVHPITVEKFYENFFEQKHFVVSKEDHNQFSDYYSFKDLEAHLKIESSRMNQSFSMSFRGNDVEKTSLCDEVGQFDFDKVMMNYHGGATIVARGLQYSNNRVLYLVRCLEKVLGHRVHVNLYATPRNSQGFSVHYDTHDVFVMQIDGRKEWRFYDFPVKYPHKRMPREYRPNLEALSDELVLQAGDLLYVPRGESHGAFCAREEASFHLTIGMNGFSLTDLLMESIQAIDYEDEELRKGLTESLFDSGCDHTKLDNLIGHAVEKISSKLSSRLAGDYLKKRESLRAACLEDIYLPPSTLWGELDINTWLQVSEDLMYDFKKLHIVLNLPYRGHPMYIRPQFTPAIKYILQKKCFTYNELPELSIEENKLLVYHLLINGFLKVVG